MSRIKLYTLSSCGACKLAKEHLDECGQDYEEVELDDNPDVIEELKSEGFKGTPIIEIDGEKKQGYSEEWFDDEVCEF